MKKAMIFMLAAAMLASLTACGGNTDSSSVESADSSAVESVESEVESETEADAEFETEAETEEVSDAESETEAEGDSAAENTAGDTVGQILLQDFKDQMAADAAATPQALADELLKNEVILFSGATMPVEPGLLSGFGNAEITGFKEGVMFAPMIGSIAFVGYVFELEEGTDAAAFMSTLETNADPRWNICVEAEETVIEQVDNKVFFLMCPKQIEG